MRHFNHHESLAYDALGELDNGLIIYTRNERMDLADIWPGKRTDLESLERNAAAFHRQERRRFFAKVAKLIAAPFKAWRANAATNRAYRNFLRWEYAGETALSAHNNFTDILARTYGTALYRDQIPVKDYRDD